MTLFLLFANLIFENLSYTKCGDVFDSSGEIDLAIYKNSTAWTPYSLSLYQKLAPEEKTQLSSVHTFWNTKEFDNVRLPIQVTEIKNKALFSEPNSIRIESMPLQMPGTSLRIPKKLMQFKEAIEAAYQFESSINPFVGEYYMYITTNQGVVAPGKTQRRSGPHSDGFQEDYLTQQGIIDRNYLVSDGIPTEFFRQPFPISHLKSAMAVLPEFEKKIDPTKTVTYKPYTLTMMDTYTVHRAGLAKVEQHRTFVKIVFSKEKFNREGNTHNDLFDYQWELVPRGLDRNSSAAKPTTMQPNGCSGMCSTCTLH